MPAGLRHSQMGLSPPFRFHPISSVMFLSVYRMECRALSTRRLPAGASPHLFRKRIAIAHAARGSSHATAQQPIAQPRAKQKTIKHPVRRERKFSLSSWSFVSLRPSIEGCQIPHTEGRGQPLCLLLLEVAGVPRNCRAARLELFPTECEFVFTTLVTMELVPAQAQPDHKRASLRRCEVAVFRKLGNSTRRYEPSKYDCSMAVFDVLEIVGRAVCLCWEYGRAAEICPTRDAIGHRGGRKPEPWR